MTEIQKYVIISLFERNQINARTLIDALNSLVLESVDTVLESLVNSNLVCSNIATDIKQYKGYSIRLYPPERENKIRLIKLVKEFLNIGLKEAKDLVDSLPATINRYSGSEYSENIKLNSNRALFTYDEAVNFQNIVVNYYDESIIDLIGIEADKE